MYLTNAVHSLLFTKYKKNFYVEKNIEIWKCILQIHFCICNTEIQFVTDIHDSQT